MRIATEIDEIIKALNEQDLIAKVNVGRLTKDYKSIAIRLMPSSNTGYYKGQRSIALTYQVLVKSDNQLEALKEIEFISEYLMLNGSTIYVEPFYLQEDEQGYIYSCSLRKDI